MPGVKKPGTGWLDMGDTVEKGYVVRKVYELLLGEVLVEDSFV